MLQSINDADLLNLIAKIDKKYSLKLNIADKFRISKLLEVYFETKKISLTFIQKIKKLITMIFLKYY